MRSKSLNLFVVTASTLTLSWAAAVADAPPRLKGSYGFTGTSACLVAPGHVGDPSGPPLPNPTPGFALPNSGFQANLVPNDAVPGSPTAAFYVSFVPRPTPGPGGFPHFAPSAGSAEYSFSFTYTVNADGTWSSTMVPGSFSETFLTGGRTGQTATTDATPPVTGMISKDGKTLIDMQTTTTTHSYSNGDVDQRICHLSRVFIKLDDDDRD